MKESIELHVFNAYYEGNSRFTIKMLGEQFHTRVLFDQNGWWSPVYTRSPRFGGDEFTFHGGPHDWPDEYSEIVARLGHVLLSVPYLQHLEVQNDRLLPGFFIDETGSPYATYGPRFVEGVAEVITDVTNRHVEVAGDVGAYAVADLRANLVERDSPDFGHIDIFDTASLPEFTD